MASSRFGGGTYPVVASEAIKQDGPYTLDAWAERRARRHRQLHGGKYNWISVRQAKARSRFVYEYAEAD